MTDSPFRFDLRTEPWIPLIDGTGVGIEIGIRDALVRAHELRGIADASPLVEIALHRLLLALLHRVVAGPRSPDEWQHLWKRGRFDEAALDAYLGQLADRFDLFGAERPFYQCRGLLAAGVRARPIARLTHELASEGNSALLFDHTVDSRFSPEKAARTLVAQQAFALGGLMTPPPSSTDKSSVDAPAARAAIFRVRGRTLFETLMVNLVRYDPASNVPVEGVARDLPAWERDAAADGASRQPSGYLDVLTWQSRRIEIEPPQSDGMVTGAAMVSGDRVAQGRDQWAIEPTMLAYVESRSRNSLAQPRAVRMSATRSLWRDSTVLLAASGADRTWRSPGVLDWAAELAFSGLGDFGESRFISLEAGGIVADQAKTLLWRRENLSVPTTGLRDPAIAERIKGALRAAERVGAMLGDGSIDSAGADAGFPRPLARIAIALLGTRERPPRSDAIRAFISGIGAAPRYWAALASPFALLLGELADAGAATDPGAERTAAIERWQEAVRVAARDAFVRATSGLGGGARTLFAVADGERAFNAGIAQVLGASRRRQEVAST